MASFWYLLREFLRIPIDIVSGIARRRYEITLPIAASKSLTWSIASAHKITLSGNPPIEIDTEPDPARPGVYTGEVRFGDQRCRFGYKILEERPGEAMSLSLLAEESDRAFDYGTDSVSAVVISGDDETSLLTGTNEVTHTGWKSRFAAPLSLLMNLSRIRKTAEEHAGTSELPQAGSQIKNALITGALTFGSFFAMFGPSVAAMLIVVILIHEFGHVIAMRWAGIPVRGIYFIPFFGGVAVGSGVAKSEVERGLVALMGPGFSLLTTAFLIFASAQSHDPLVRQPALTSALLNGFNLLPIFPLDGGHIAQAMLSRAGTQTLRAFQVVTMFAGGALALWANDYLLLTLLFLIAPSLIAKPAEGALQLPPISRGDLAWLSIGYGATFLFYALAISRLWGVDISAET